MNHKDLLKTIRHLEIITSKRVDDIFAGNYKSSFRGQGYEFSELRKYEEGDDVRHIDWITTAKQGSVFVKKFQESRELTTILLIDVSATMNFGTSEKNKSRISLELSSLLLFSALKNNDKFGAILFAGDVYSYVPAKKGRNHILRIIRETLLAFDENIQVESDLKKALDFLNSTVKRQSICFLLGDDISRLSKQNKNALSALKISNKKHDFIYFNIFDEFERGIKEKYPALEMIDLKSGQKNIFDLNNKKLIQNYNKRRKKKYDLEEDILKKNNIDYLFISTQSNIYKELLFFFKRRSLKY